MKQFLIAFALIVGLISCVGIRKDANSKEHVHAPCQPRECPESGIILPVAKYEVINKTQAITYSLGTYYCKLCRQWYSEKVGVDTISINKVPTAPQQ